MERWSIIFKILGNINRLKIIKLLSGGQSLNVTGVSERLKISFKATSQHLIRLQRLEVLAAQGRSGHVFYSINPEMPTDFKKAIALFI